MCSYAYVEFAETEAIDPALAMDNSLFRGRLIKVRPITHTIPREKADEGIRRR